MSVTFTPRSADRIAKITQWAEKEVGLKRDPSGTSLPADVVYVLTTSGTATSGLYPGKVVLYDANADTWREFGTVKLKAANSETLSNSTRYAARYTGTTSGGDDVFTVLQGGGGLTAEEADGSPSYTGVTKLQFDQADGFVLSNPATGQVRIDISAATTTQTGVVSTISQTFGGDKTFNDSITGMKDMNLINGSGSGSDFNFSDGYGNTLRIVGYPPTPATNYEGGLRISKPGSSAGILMLSYQSGIALGILGSDGSYVANMASQTTPGTNQGSFSVKDYQGTKNGIWGTLGSGAKVAGGIVYSLGTVVVQSSSWMGF